MEKFPSYNNDFDYVVLFDENMQVIDELFYTEKMHHLLLAEEKGISLERISFHSKIQTILKTGIRPPQLRVTEHPATKIRRKKLKVFLLQKSLSILNHFHPISMVTTMNTRLIMNWKNPVTWPTLAFSMQPAGL